MTCKAKDWFTGKDELDCPTCNRGPCRMAFYVPVAPGATTPPRELIESYAKARGIKDAVELGRGENANGVPRVMYGVAELGEL